MSLSPPPFGPIFLMGPTAAGKTELAVALTEQLPCDIISVDSALVYRGMDIGTAKPDVDTLARAPHRLIDIIDPADCYSAAAFRRDALREIAAIQAVGRIPLLVGGTMLYYRALQNGLAILPEADPEIRERLEAEAAIEGWEVLHRRLAEVDPQAAARIHPNDPQRLQRALEVYELTGRAMSELWREQSQEPLPFPVTKLIVAPTSRSELHQRIAHRFDRMLTQGFIEEVETLFQRGDLHLELPSMRCVGYRQAWQYLIGELSKEAMRERAIIATRQLAKRQYTWLRGEGQTEWLDPSGGELLALSLKILKKGQYNL